MAKLLHKRSATPAKVPLTTDLTLGELSVNTNDGKLFLKKNNGADAIVEVGAQTLTGDATGSGNGTINVVFANTGVAAGTYTKLTVDVKGRVTAATIMNNADVVASLGYTPESIGNKNIANGYAGLDSGGKISTSVLPAIALVNTFVVATQAAMLALTAQTGDVAVRTDLQKSFILAGASSSTLADWQELLSPTGAVVSVNSQTGVISLTTTNIPEGTNLYHTTARAAAAAPVQTVAGRTGAVVIAQADVTGLTTASTPSFARVFGGNGTAAAPTYSYQNEGSGDTGMYWGGEGYTNFSSNGVWAASIGPAGIQAAGSVTAATINSTGLLSQGGNAVLHAANYNSYVPSLTGAGASGSWPISINGTAANVSGLAITTLAGLTDLNTVVTSGFYRLQNGMVNSPAVAYDYGQLLVIHGASDTITQVAWNYGTGAMATRSGNPTQVGGGGTWGAWRFILDTSNFGTVAPSLTGTGASGTWNINVLGIANKASTLAQNGGAGAAMTFNWSGQGGSPTWVWGGSDGVNNYVYNPSNFNVANSDKLGGLAATSTLQKRRVNIGNASGYTLNDAGFYNGTYGSEYGFSYGGSGEAVGPYIHFGGLNQTNNYGCQISANYGDGSIMRFRTRNDDLSAWNPWRDIFHTGNMTLNTGAVGNSVMQRDVSGDGWVRYLNSTDNGTSGTFQAVTGIIAKTGDNYHRTVDAQSVRNYLGQGMALLSSNSNNTITAIDTLNSNAIGYCNGISILGQTDGALYAQAHTAPWQHQIYGDYRTGQIALRGKNSGVWQPWRTVIDSGNIAAQNVAYATSATRLYATGAPYDFGNTSPYYLTMTYNSTANRWRLAATPATPASVEVAYADAAGTAGSATALTITTDETYNGAEYVTLNRGSGVGSQFNTAKLAFNPNTGTLSVATAVVTGRMYSNGNMHVDPSPTSATYLNYYQGTGGVNFCNGAAGVVASVSAAGVFTGIGTGISGTAAGLNVGGYSSRIQPVTQYSWSVNTLPNGYNDGMQSSFVSMNEGWFSYGHVINIKGYGGGPGASMQTYIPYGAAYGGVDVKYRLGDQAANAWGGWKVWMDDSNLGSYMANRVAGNANSISSAVGGTYYWTGVNYFQSNKGAGSYLGSNATYALEAYSNDGGSAAMSFHRGGSYAINMGLDPDGMFRIGGWSAPANLFNMDMSGNLTMANNVTAYSDERLKKNWRALRSNFVSHWANVKYGIYDRIDNDSTQAGLSAQSVQEVLPEVVLTNTDGMLSLNYGAAAAVATVELAKEVVELRKQVCDQNLIINTLIKRLELLEAK